MNRYRLPIVVGALLIFVIVAGRVVSTNVSTGAGTSTRIDVTVTGGKSMSPSTWTAHHNDTVTVNITSDADGEVHLHGYDIAFEAKAGQVVSQTFKAVNTGDFPIEWEATSTPLGDFKVSP